jgi:hypothetical protein
MSQSSFTARKRLFFRSPVLLAGIAVVCTAISLCMFYETIVRQHKAYLSNEVVKQLNWLSAIGRSNQWDSQETQKQYVEYLRRSPIVGKTGECVVAMKEGEDVRLLLPADALDAAPRPIAMCDALGEPMQQALAGNVGTMIGVDHRGHQVLAAFAPVPHLNWGIVVKSDRDEVLLPFLKSAAIIALTVLAVIIVGIPLVVHLGRPLINELEQSQEGVALAIHATERGVQT